MLIIYRGEGMNQESDEAEGGAIFKPKDNTQNSKTKQSGGTDREGTETSARQLILKTDQRTTRKTSIPVPTLSYTGRTGGHTFLMGVKRGHPI